MSGYDKMRLKIIEKGTFDQYENIIKGVEKARPDYADILKYSAAIANSLNDANIKYSLIGGYAVLHHLAETMGEDVFLTWRGSHDIDLVSPDFQTKDVIIADFFAKGGRSTNRALKKYSYNLRDDEIEKDCELDLYVPIQGKLSINGRPLDEDFFKNVEKKNFYGIEIAVPSIVDIVKMKLDIKKRNELRPKDIQDIKDMMDVAQMQGLDVEKKLYNDELAYLKEIRG